MKRFILRSLCSLRFSNLSKNSHLSTLRAMSSKSDHLQRTAHHTRHEIMSLATVVRIRNESKTVKSLDLKIENPDFTFKAGQWVDTHIPGVETVGGFSMCSSPSLLHTEGILQLAIKKSRHPPADWVHTKCKEGDRVELRVGGDYFYSPKIGAPPHSVLLVGGGVGINPLISMMNHISDLHNKQEVFRPNKVILMYSAKTLKELLFKERIQDICSNVKTISAMLFVTAEKCSEKDIKCNRIQEADIQEAVEKLKPDKLECYLCGPSPMIEDIESILKKSGVQDSSIHYERWW